MTTQEPTRDELKREVRTLNWKLKTSNKQCGKQGAEIYRLRNENAALRAGLERSPGDYERLLQKVRESQEENRVLREKLSAE